MSEVTKKVKILIPCILKTVHYRLYKCTVILHVPMVRAHRESSMSKLDYDAKRVAIIYMELLQRNLVWIAMGSLTPLDTTPVTTSQ